VVDRKVGSGRRRVSASDAVLPMPSSSPAAPPSAYSHLFESAAAGVRPDAYTDASDDGDRPVPVLPAAAGGDPHWAPPWPSPAPQPQPGPLPTSDRMTALHQYLMAQQRAMPHAPFGQGIDVSVPWMTPPPSPMQISGSLPPPVMPPLDINLRALVQIRREFVDMVGVLQADVETMRSAVVELARYCAPCLDIASLLPPVRPAIHVSLNALSVAASVASSSVVDARRSMGAQGTGLPTGALGQPLSATPASRPSHQTPSPAVVSAPLPPASAAPRMPSPALQPLSSPPGHARDAAVDAAQPKHPAVESAGENDIPSIDDEGQPAAVLRAVVPLGAVIARANAAFCRLFGYDMDDIVGKTWEVLVPDSMVSHYEQLWSPMTVQGPGETRSTAIKGRWVRATGETFSEAVHTICGYDGDGLLKYMIAYWLIDDFVE
jgi:PAS domain-containing protein